MNNNKSLTGALLVLAAGLLWSTNAPFVRWISVDAFTTAALRALIAAAVLAPFFNRSASASAKISFSSCSVLPHCLSALYSPSK